MQKKINPHQRKIRIKKKPFGTPGQKNERNPLALPAKKIKETLWHSRQNKRNPLALPPKIKIIVLWWRGDLIPKVTYNYINFIVLISSVFCKILDPITKNSYPLNCMFFYYEMN